MDNFTRSIKRKSQDVNNGQKDKRKIDKFHLTENTIVAQCCFMAELKLLLTLLSKLRKITSITIYTLKPYTTEETSKVADYHYYNYSNNEKIMISCTTTDASVSIMSYIPNNNIINNQSLNHFFRFYCSIQNANEMKHFIVFTTSDIDIQKMSRLGIKFHKESSHFTYLENDFIKSTQINFFIPEVKRDHALLIESFNINDSDSKEKLDNFFDTLVICKLELEKGDHLNTFIRHEIGEHFNIVDIPLAEKITDILLNRNFSGEINIQELFKFLKKEIDTDFDRRIEHNLVSLSYYVSDSDDKNVKETAKKLLLTTSIPQVLKTFIDQKNFNLLSELINNSKEANKIELIQKLKNYLKKCPLEYISDVLAEEDKDEDILVSITKLNKCLFDEQPPTSSIYNILVTLTRYGHCQTSRYFMDNCEPEQITSFFKTAVKEEKLEFLDYLLKNYEDKILINGNTELHLACEIDASFEVIEFLANELNINSVNHQGKTPLHVAVKNRLSDDKAIEQLKFLGAQL